MSDDSVNEASEMTTSSMKGADIVSGSLQVTEEMNTQIGLDKVLDGKKAESMTADGGLAYMGGEVNLEFQNSNIGGEVNAINDFLLEKEFDNNKGELFKEGGQPFRKENGQ